MTQDEAKKKWCPVAGLAGAVMKVTDGNRGCIGSACMMWRWNEGTKTTCRYPEGTKPTPEDQWQGYCGLGGKP